MIMIIAFFCFSLFSSLNSLSIEKIVASQQQWTLHDDYFLSCFTTGLKELSGRNIALMLASWDMVMNHASSVEKKPIKTFYQRANIFYPKIEAFFNHPLNNFCLDTQILLKHAFYNDNLAQIFLKAHKLGFERKDLQTLREIIETIASPERGNYLRKMTKNLYTAVHFGHCKNIETAIECETPINAIISPMGSTALIIAAKNNFIYSARILLRHLNLNVNAREWDSNFSGMTALHHAIMHGNAKMCKLILQHKKIDIDIQNDCGNSALMLAASIGRTDLIKLILFYFPATNLRLKNQDGKRAIDLAPAIFIKKILSNHFHWQKLQLFS